MNELTNQEWYQHLIEECKAIITEAIFTSRWALVEGYHQLGIRILEDEPKISQGGSTLRQTLQDLANLLHISERTLYYAVETAQKYPDIQTLPEGKNITWNKLITKYLPEPKNNKIVIPPPKGTYNVIIIDPPWPYGTKYNQENRRVASPYPEQTIEKIKEFPIPSAPDCVMWLWTTHKFLPDAFELLKYWGFEYKITFVWDKQKMGMGAWLRCQSEFCLLGIKGNPRWELTNERDILSEARREHSRKPDTFYKMVERLTPEAKRIDYFSREKREGFDQYGNETDKF